MGSLMPGWEGESPKASEERKVPEWLDNLRRTSTGVQRYSLQDRHTQRVSLESEDTPGQQPGSPQAGSPRFGSPRHISIGGSGAIPVQQFGKSKTMQHHHSPQEERIQWWTKVDSGSFNEARMNLPEEYRRGSYVPQHETARVHKQKEQMHDELLQRVHEEQEVSTEQANEPGQTTTEPTPVE